MWLYLTLLAAAAIDGANGQTLITQISRTWCIDDMIRVYAPHARTCVADLQRFMR